MRRQPLPFDPNRFEITEKRLLGPIYTVTIVDKQTAVKVPQTQGLLLGRASVRRQIQWSIDQYQRRNPGLFPPAN